MARPLHDLRELAGRTPSSRNRYVDTLRALAITLVVLGHWLITVIEYTPDGRLTGHSALPYLPWAPPFTWLVQVMPIFFLVGGYANAASLTSQRRHGGGTLDWLLDRGRRLLWPTTVLLAALVLAALAGRLAGADPKLVRNGVWFASVPLWFLSTYLVVIVLTPPMLALHRRYGLAVPLALAALVVLGDVARLNGHGGLALGSYLFGWLAIHQVGLAWRDANPATADGPSADMTDGRAGGQAGGRTGGQAGGRTGGLAGGVAGAAKGPGWPGRPGIAVLLLVGGLAATVLLTWLGPYPVSMIDIQGERLHNMSPPTVALLTLATAQIGLILLLRPAPGSRLPAILQKSPPFTRFGRQQLQDRADLGVEGRRASMGWTAVVGVNAVILTIFLWHVSAVILLAGLLDLLDLLPTPPVGSLTWWLWRLPWLLMLSVLLAGLVAIFGRFETRAARRSGPRRAPTRRYAAVQWTLTLAGLAATVAGLIGNNVAPRDGVHPLGMPTWAFTSYLAGVAMLELVRRTGPPPTR